MSRRQLAALLAGSALVTFDGTAATVSLPAIAHDLRMSFEHTQWISGSPLLAMAALLMAGGALADRYGRLRLFRTGVALFGVGSTLCAVAPSGSMLIAARAVQGAGAALLLPAAIAHLRAAYSEPAERARRFGVWAAWTGVASAIGPILGGVLADVLSWRAVFVSSAAVAAASLVLLNGARGEPAGRGAPLPVLKTFALALFLASSASLLIGARTLNWSSPYILITAVAMLVSASWIWQAPRCSLLPRELLTTRNCVPANGATFGLYFGMFGLSFLLVLYTQQVLGYSGMWAGAAVMPISVMLFFAEPLGRMAPRVGARSVIMLGSATAAAGILWMAAGPHPLPFWSRIVVGTTVFGLGVSVAVSALTNAAISAVPERCAGAASGFNHATVRASGLLAIAALGFIAGDRESNAVSIEGFRRAMMICGLVVAAGGVAGGLRISDSEPGGLEQAS